MRVESEFGQRIIRLVRFANIWIEGLYSLLSHMVATMDVSEGPSER